MYLRDLLRHPRAICAHPVDFLMYPLDFSAQPRDLPASPVGFSTNPFQFSPQGTEFPLPAPSSRARGKDLPPSAAACFFGGDASHRGSRGEPGKGSWNHGLHGPRGTRKWRGGAGFPPAGEGAGDPRPSSKRLASVGSVLLFLKVFAARANCPTLFLTAETRRSAEWASAVFSASLRVSAVSSGGPFGWRLRRPGSSVVSISEFGFSHRARCGLQVRAPNAPA